MLNMPAEIAEMGQLIPLIVALAIAVVGFGVQRALCRNAKVLMLKIIPLFVYAVLFACLVEVFFNPFDWHSEWHKLFAIANGVIAFIGLSGIVIAWCVYGVNGHNEGRGN